MSKRNTRSSKHGKQPAGPRPPSPTVSESELAPHGGSPPFSFPVRPADASSMWAPPTTNKDKARLMKEYAALFDRIEPIKQALVEAEAEDQSGPGRALSSGLVSLRLFLLYNGTESPCSRNWRLSSPR